MSALGRSAALPSMRQRLNFGIAFPFWISSTPVATQRARIAPRKSSGLKRQASSRCYWGDPSVGYVDMMRPAAGWLGHVCYGIVPDRTSILPYHLVEEPANRETGG